MVGASGNGSPMIALRPGILSSGPRRIRCCRIYTAGRDAWGHLAARHRQRRCARDAVSELASVTSVADLEGVLEGSNFSLARIELVEQPRDLRSALRWRRRATRRIRRRRRRMRRRGSAWEICVLVLSIAANFGLHQVAVRRAGSTAIDRPSCASATAVAAGA